MCVIYHTRRPIRQHENKPRVSPRCLHITHKIKRHGARESRDLYTGKSSLNKIQAFKRKASTSIIDDPCIPLFMYKDNGSNKEIRSNHDALNWKLLSA